MSATELLQACFECGGYGRKGFWRCQKCLGKGEHIAECNVCGQEAVKFNAEEREYHCADCAEDWELSEYGQADWEFEEPGP